MRCLAVERDDGERSLLLVLFRVGLLLRRQVLVKCVMLVTIVNDVTTVVFCRQGQMQGVRVFVSIVQGMRRVATAICGREGLLVMFRTSFPPAGDRAIVPCLL